MSRSDHASARPPASHPEGAVTWVLQLPHEVALAESTSDVRVTEGAGFRAAPLLAVVAAGEHRLVVVGQTRIWTQPDGSVEVHVLVRALWQATRRSFAVQGNEVDSTAFVDWTAILDHSELRPALRRLVDIAPQSSSTDVQERATSLSKDLAEHSRNAVSRLRSLRYALERQLAAVVREGTKDVEGLLADVLELSTAAGRARDEARAALREGLWTWRTDDAAYQAQRRQRDPSLPPREGEAAARERPWFLTFDAAVRQCASMQEQLAEEAGTLQSLLTAVSTIAVTRDARSQEALTLIAAVGGILLGVPGLVLALYGASSVLPLTGRNLVYLVPLGGAAFLAVVIAAFLPGRGRRAWKLRVGLTTLAVVVTTLVLLYAGALYTPRT